MKLIIALLCIVIILNIYKILTKTNQCPTPKPTRPIETQNQLTAHRSKAIVLNCMDFRLIDDLTRFFDQLGYNNNYDDFILAGASLGFNQTKYPHWKKIFLRHVELARTLHHIKEIIIVDHMDCGAYKLFYNKTSIPQDEEHRLHVQNLMDMEKELRKLFPDLSVKKFLMKIDGSVESI